MPRSIRGQHERRWSGPDRTERSVADARCGDGAIVSGPAPRAAYSAIAHDDATPRAIGLAGALSANLLNMIGIGPFITIPLALAAMGGPQALLGWLLGAVLCLFDGFV